MSLAGRPGSNGLAATRFRPRARHALMAHNPREETMRVDFIIDGEAVGAASGATFTRKDPVTGAVASEAAAASEADVARAVEAAHRAFPAWSETGPNERRA